MQVKERIECILPDLSAVGSSRGMVGAVEVVDVVGINVVGVDVVEVDLVRVDVVVVDVVRVEAVDVVGTMYAGLPILFAGREVLLGIGGEVKVVLGKVGEEEV